MGIVIAVVIGFFLYYVLPFLAFFSWIYRFTVIVRENEEKETITSFEQSLKDTLKQCHGIKFFMAIYCVGMCMDISGSYWSVVEILFTSKVFAPLGPPGYFVIGCLLIGLVYSYVFYKRHSK